MQLSYYSSIYLFIYLLPRTPQQLTPSVCCGTVSMFPVYLSPHVRESGSRSLEKLGLRNPESWAWESGIQPKKSRIPLTIGIRNPSSTEKDLESSNWTPESTARNPESKTVLDSLTWRDILAVTHGRPHQPRGTEFFRSLLTSGKILYP